MVSERLTDPQKDTISLPGMLTVKAPVIPHISSREVVENDLMSNCLYSLSAFRDEIRTDRFAAVRLHDRVTPCHPIPKPAKLHARLPGQILRSSFALHLGIYFQNRHCGN